MSTLTSHHLPTEINASTMVIRSARGHWRWLLDALLTAIAWGAFIYLFARGLWSVTTQRMNGVDLPWLSQVLPTLSDLSVYIFAMLIQAGILLLWAQYNFWRFRGKQRRAPYTSLAQVNLLSYYGISAQSLHALRTLPISVIHHAHDGSITYTESSLHAPPTSKLDANATSRPPK